MLGKLYKITLDDRVIYVGQTLQELTARIAQHKKSDSLVGRKINKGYDLKFEIIKEVPISELDAWECFYIGYFNTLHPNGLNLQLPFSSARMTETTRNKIRKSKTYGKVYTIDLQGTILEFESGRHAALSLKINIAHIYECINGKRYAAGDRAFWREGQQPKNVADIRQRPRIAVCTVNTNTGEQQHFPSVYSCAMMLNIDPATICKGLKDKKEIKYKHYKIRKAI